ncbi:hypothetical protein ABW19_dt0204597 [Dactylella cylindrospora]|nr:hypothetical protein ABW19_dt0204597 [Dactylella cylindrospora]
MRMWRTCCSPTTFPSHSAEKCTSGLVYRWCLTSRIRGYMPSLREWKRILVDTWSVYIPGGKLVATAKVWKVALVPLFGVWWADKRRNAAQRCHGISGLRRKGCVEEKLELGCRLLTEAFNHGGFAQAEFS